MFLLIFLRISFPLPTAAAGTIRLDLAQYREMAVFTQFSSDLDETTRRQLAYGEGLLRLLRQPQYAPLCQHRQVVLLCAALAHVFGPLAPDEIERFCSFLLKEAETRVPDVCAGIDRSGTLSAEARETIVDLARKLREEFSAGEANGA